MELIQIIILFLIGIFCIVKGGDYFVDAASWIAEISGIPKLIVGATIVSVATTLPEMIVSVMAASEGKVDMSIGNAVGSVTANIGLIMAIALICMPGMIKRKDYLLKSILMLLAAAAIMIGGFLGEINIALAAILLVIFIAFMIDNIMTAIKAMDDKNDEEQLDKPTRKEVIRKMIEFVVGAAGIVLGAQLLVDNGSELARLIGVSERIIGVTVIAVGTSLPELVTTITAIMKKQSSLSVGNILGANIFDLTLILPLCSFVSGQSLPVSSTSSMLDLPICLVVGFIAVIPALIYNRFQRWQGIVLLTVYCIYVYATCFIFA